MREGAGLRLRYADLTTSEGVLPVAVEIDLTPTAEGLVLRARIHNGWTERIPQVVFPQLFGLGPADRADDTRLQLGRGCLHPFRDLMLRPDNALYLDLGLYHYYNLDLVRLILSG